jgi:hypothetical protein
MDYNFDRVNSNELPNLDSNMFYTNNDTVYQFNKLNTSSNPTGNLTTGETCLNTEEMNQFHKPKRDIYWDVEKQDEGFEDLDDLIKKTFLTVNNKSEFELEVEDDIHMTENTEQLEYHEPAEKDDSPVNIFSKPMPVKDEPIDMSVYGTELQLRRDNFFKLFHVKFYNCLEYQLNEYIYQVTGDPLLVIEISQYLIKEVNKRVVSASLEAALGKVLVKDFSTECKIPSISKYKTAKVLERNKHAIDRFNKITEGKDRLFEYPLKDYIEMYLTSQDYVNNHKLFVKEKFAHSNFRVYNIEYKKEIKNYLNYFLSNNFK